MPDFTALPLARREDLTTWRLHLLATHVLVGGATRRGKGSVLWSLVRALGGGVASGLVRLWVIDPKGGMEFAMGRPFDQMPPLATEERAPVPYIQAGKNMINFLGQAKGYRPVAVTKCNAVFIRADIET